MTLTNMPFIPSHLLIGCGWRVAPGAPCNRAQMAGGRRGI